MEFKKNNAVSLHETWKLDYTPELLKEGGGANPHSNKDAYTKSIYPLHEENESNI
jgi:hypothetical protein